MIKSFSACNRAGIPDEADLELINKYALVPLKKEEVFVFSVILCDNEIDRDFERFSEESLYALEKLFEGKTGILNHSMQSEDQNARAYRAKVIKDGSKKTADGLDYMYLKAWCYTVRSEKNASFIRDIESGIKKEVSISCSAGKKVCSVCGKTGCSHKKGGVYSGRLCFMTIEDITDAYEWSFVAVPAQKNAGVTKSAKINKKENSMENILKSVKNGESLTLERDEVKKLSSYIAALEKESADGRLYRESLVKKAKKYFAVAIDSLSGDCVDSLLENQTCENLEELCSALKKQASAVIGPVPQLLREEKKTDTGANSQFKF